MPEQTSRGQILARYGLPDVLNFRFDSQQDGQQTLRVIVGYPGGTASMSIGHLSSLAHEIASADRGLSDQIQDLVRKINAKRS